MKDALKDLPAQLRTPLGRRSFWGGVRYRTFPLYAALATAGLVSEMSDAGARLGESAGRDVKIGFRNMQNTRVPDKPYIA